MNNKFQSYLYNYAKEYGNLCNGASEGPWSLTEFGIEDVYGNDIVSFDDVSFNGYGYFPAIGAANRKVIENAFLMAEKYNKIADALEKLSVYIEEAGNEDVKEKLKELGIWAGA